jgi:hypothetical protein
VSPVKYEMSSYIPEDDVLHSLCREHLKSYIILVSSPSVVDITQANLRLLWPAI